LKKVKEEGEKRPRSVVEKRTGYLTKWKTKRGERATCSQNKKGERSAKQKRGGKKKKGKHGFVPEGCRATRKERSEAGQPPRNKRMPEWGECNCEGHRTDERKEEKKADGTDLGEKGKGDKLTKKGKGEAK